MTIRYNSCNFEPKLFTTMGTGTSSYFFSLSVGVPYSSKSNTIADEAALPTLLIVKDKSICRGKPIIAGTRIGVSNIVELHSILNWSIFKIRDEYPELTTEQINAAIEYYQNHTQEIDGYLQQDREIDGE